MIEKATDQTLKNGFETHLAETKGQIVRLEKVFKMHGVEVEGRRLPRHRRNSGRSKRDRRRSRRQASSRCCPHRRSWAVEHYEITRYGTLIAWAKKLGRDDCAAVLQQNLEEEKAADQKLNTMALRKRKSEGRLSGYTTRGTKAVRSAGGLLLKEQLMDAIRMLRTAAVMSLRGRARRRRECTSHGRGIVIFIIGSKLG